MQSLIYYWTAGLVGLSVLYFVVPVKFKNIVSDCLLGLSTVFLALAYGSTFEHHSQRLSKSPTVSADQQELILKLDYSTNKIYAMVGRTNMISRKSQFVESAENNLRTLSRAQPDSEMIAAKLALVAHEAGDTSVVKEALTRMEQIEAVEVALARDEGAVKSNSAADEQHDNAIDGRYGLGPKGGKPEVDVSEAGKSEAGKSKVGKSKAGKSEVGKSEVAKPEIGERSRSERGDRERSISKGGFAEAFTTIYGGRESRKKLNLAEVAHFEKVFNDKLPAGWYRDVALMELYGASGHKAKLEALRDSFDQKCLATVFKMALLTIFGAISFLLGVVVIAIQLFFLPRTVTSPENLALIQAPANYGVKNVAGVFTGWLTIQNLVGLLLQHSQKPHSLWNSGSLATAATVIVLYLLTVLPVLLLLWLFAFRPTGVDFFEGIKLRFRVGKLGPFKLFGIGALAWFAALPMVAIAAGIAFKFLHSQGSSNPALGLVMESARAANASVLVLVFLMIAVLAPFFEEALFRGFLYSYLRRKMNVPLAAFLSALIFASVHLDGGGFLPLFVLGFVFAFVFERTKSIVPSIVAHGMWNSGTILILLLLFQS